MLLAYVIEYIVDGQHIIERQIVWLQAGEPASARLQQIRDSKPGDVIWTESGTFDLLADAVRAIGGRQHADR